MNKRVFPIDKYCYLIFTGLSSSDNLSFVRIGNSKKIDEYIQKHIKHIVVSDANTLNMDIEKDNISSMEAGKIRYICNKKNQDILYNSLSKRGVDVNKLFIKELSTDLDNISKIENKKHFFTIFYDNKNVKLVYNEEIFFDYFESNKLDFNYTLEIERLLNFIKILDKLNSDLKKNVIPKEEITITSKKIVFQNSYLFLVQDDLYFPLSLGMFQIKDINLNEKNFLLFFNCSIRFYVGKQISLILLEKDKKILTIDGLIVQGEIIESEVLYNYKVKFEFMEIDDFNCLVSFYKNFLKKSNK